MTTKQFIILIKQVLYSTDDSNLLYVCRKSKITEHEQAVLARIFAFFPLPENVTLGDYDHVDVKEFFRTKGTDYRRQLYVFQI